MDPSEENHILDNFRKISREKGQTMIVVTHNLSSIAKHADNILCVSINSIHFGVTLTVD